MFTLSKINLSNIIGKTIMVCLLLSLDYFLDERKSKGNNVSNNLFPDNINPNGLVNNKRTYNSNGHEFDVEQHKRTLPEGKKRSRSNELLANEYGIYDLAENQVFIPPYKKNKKK